MTSLFIFFQYYSNLIFELINYYINQTTVTGIQIEIFKYSNYIVYYLSMYLKLIQDFYIQNTYLCIGFFVNYTFLYLLYYTYLYYVNNIPKDIEQKLNLNKELLTRNSFLENIIKNVNSNCLNLTFENSNFQQQLEILSKEKQQIYDENNKLIEKISHCENNIKYFQNVLYDIEMYLVEHNDVSTVKRYLLNTLKPSKKRKYIL
jgi:hypothetical protein